jgi:polysaccharide export outer membrane protein
MYKIKIFVYFSLLFFQVVSYANESVYKINPGDLLDISVWKEEELQREIRVLPDGQISFPLVGDINTTGLTLSQLKTRIVKKLSDFISDPVVNISVKLAEGNVVYVIGQVKKPGQFIMYRPLDTMQVLSLAGGLTTFAKSNDIIILRRDEKGSKAIKFEYSELEDGDSLDKNHILKSGDVIVVP